MKYYFQVLLAISVYMSHFDPFHSMCWVFISRDTRDFDIIREADRIASKVSASLWEAASCATPDIRTGEVHIEAHCFNYIGNYKNTVIADNPVYEKWNPDLSSLMEEKSKEVKADMVSLLTDMAASYFDGTISPGGDHYVIRVRD